jgi:alkylation response protein AidB-like acyl-CoA dehydrogenase
MLDFVLCVDELAQGSVALAIPFVTTASLGARVLAGLGTSEQKRTLLSELIAGRLVTTFAWTEPAGGSDVLAMTTRAERSPDGSEYTLHGTKTFITLADAADVLFTMARTDPAPEKRSHGLTCLAVPRATEGVSIRRIEKMGQRATPFCEVSFQRATVPAAARIGDEGQAWRQLVPMLVSERTCFAAVCVGIARAAFDDACGYADQRTAFGRTIDHFQAIQHHLVNMRTLIDTAELVTYKAAWAESEGKSVTFEATQALLVAAEAVGVVTDLGVQILGGYGVTTEFDAERYWRDARIFRVSPITSEVARNVLARGLNLPQHV